MIILAAVLKGLKGMTFTQIPPIPGARLAVNFPLNPTSACAHNSGDKH